MIKAFKENYQNKWYNIKIINIETGEFTTYHQDRTIGFPFGKPYTRTVYEMGYKDVKSCLTELKRRGILGQEIDYNEQMESEKIGYINLGVDRIKRHKRINTLDFKDVIEKLENYGLGFVDAQNIIGATYLNSIEC